MMKRIVLTMMSLALLQSNVSPASNVVLKSQDQGVPKNIIFVIVDGMGLAQADAAEIYMGGEKVRFQEFPFQGTVTTHNVLGKVTDSAAAATAMATGEKVANGVVSEHIPGDASPIKTMLERAKEMGKSTGLVTNTLFTDATPAAFGAHAPTRLEAENILNDYFTDSLPNVVFGADEDSYREKVKVAKAPFLVATSKTALALKTAEAVSKGACDVHSCPHVYGGFGSHPMLAGQIESWKALPIEAATAEYFAAHDIPHLSDMASAALSVLSQNQNGFFLMLESGLVDWIGHRNRSFAETTPSTSSVHALGMEFQELNRTLDVLLEFLKTHPDTLIVVTADHETGGLVIDKEQTNCLGQIGCLAKVKWTSELKEGDPERVATHTGVNVGVYATGRNAHSFASAGVTPMDNTEFVSRIFAPAASVL